MLSETFFRFHYGTDRVPFDHLSDKGGVTPTESNSDKKIQLKANPIVPHKWKYLFSNGNM